MGQKVAVGLSGGVDSSVSAALLIEHGYEVTGVYLTCWDGPGCTSEQDRQDALDIALQLGIPFVHLDFQQTYKEKVYEYMVSEYQAGRTPNPDVVCNREIKFGLFYEWAIEQGFDYVATGHYAQIGNCSQQSHFDVLDLPQAGSGSARQNETLCLLRSVDEHKDQTYFLYQLRGEQLEHILFPIGHLLKSQVRVEAEKRGLLTAKKPDSVGICFIGEKPMGDFLRQRIEEREGKIIMITTSTPHNSLDLQSVSLNKGDSIEVGTHKGVWFYTIGQKIAVDHNKIEGFDKTNLPYFYVISKDVEKNILYVGTKEQLSKTELVVGDIHWISGQLDSEIVRSLDRITIRIRHTGELVEIKKLTIKRSNELTIKLATSVRGVAPGQSVVFYQDSVCLGGGVIQ